MTNNALVEALREARLQLEYLDGRWPTGTTPAILTKIDTALASSGNATGDDKGLVEWTEPAKGNGKTEFYDHCYGDTPLGRFKIEWKSWKDYPGYSLMFLPPDEEFIPCGDTLESAQKTAEIWLRDRLTALSSGNEVAKVVGWLRGLDRDEWYPSDVADALLRGDHLASDAAPLTGG